MDDKQQESPSNDCNASTFPSTTSYQHFADNISDQVTRSSTLVSSKLGLELIIEKMKLKNRQVHGASENVRSAFLDRRKRYESTLKMFEKHQERSKRNLELCRERQTACVQEMERLERVIEAMRNKLVEIGAEMTDDEDLEESARDADTEE